MRPATLFVLLGSATAFAAANAAASETFPGVIQAELGLKKAPDCTLCHQSNAGGENTATEPFGRTLQRFGVVKKNDQSLIEALQQIDYQDYDTDGDCVPDIVELQHGTNPNVPDIASVAPPSEAGGPSDGGAPPDGGQSPDGGDASDGGRPSGSGPRRCSAPNLPPTLETGCAISSRNRNTPPLEALLGFCILVRVLKRRGKKSVSASVSSRAG